MFLKLKKIFKHNFFKNKKLFKKKKKSAIFVKSSLFAFVIVLGGMITAVSAVSIITNTKSEASDDGLWKCTHFKYTESETCTGEKTTQVVYSWHNLSESCVKIDKPNPPWKSLKRICTFVSGACNFSPFPVSGGLKCNCIIPKGSDVGTIDRNSCVSDSTTTPTPTPTTSPTPTPRVTPTPTGGVGETPRPLGRCGETCVSNNDCQSGLSCIHTKVCWNTNVCGKNTTKGLFIKGKVVSCNGNGVKDAVVKVYRDDQRLDFTLKTDRNGEWLLTTDANWAQQGLGTFKVESENKYKPSNNLDKGCNETSNAYKSCKTDGWNTSTGAVREAFDFVESNCDITKESNPEGYLGGSPNGNLIYGSSKRIHATASDKDGDLKYMSVYYRIDPSGGSKYGSWVNIYNYDNLSGKDKKSFSKEDGKILCDATKKGKIQVVINAIDYQGNKCTGNPNRSSGWDKCNGNATYPPIFEYLCSAPPKS